MTRIFLLPTQTRPKLIGGIVDLCSDFKVAAKTNRRPIRFPRPINDFSLKEEVAMCFGDEDHFPEDVDWLGDVTRLVYV